MPDEVIQPILLKTNLTPLQSKKNTREEIHRKACDEINDRYYGDSFSINDNYNIRNFSEQYSVEDSASLELPTGN